MLRRRRRRNIACRKAAGSKFPAASCTVSYGKRPSVLLPETSLLLTATMVCNSVTLSVSVEIRLSNLSMLLPMLSSMSASVTAFLTASFIHFWASSTTAWSCSWLTHSLKPLGLLSPVCSPPTIVNTKTGTNGESYPYQMTTWLQWCHFS